MNVNKSRYMSSLIYGEKTSLYVALAQKKDCPQPSTTNKLKQTKKITTVGTLQLDVTSHWALKRIFYRHNYFFLSPIPSSDKTECKNLS